MRESHRLSALAYIRGVSVAGIFLDAARERYPCWADLVAARDFRVYLKDYRIPEYVVAHIDANFKDWMMDEYALVHPFWF